MTASSSSYAPVSWATTEATPLQTTSTQQTFNKLLIITVSEPQKHGEGSQAFVSYLVKTVTSLPGFKASELYVRRRFQDFVLLHKQLQEEHPACILPPRPGKHRMEYITGDRFSPEFIEKRRISLQAYLDRLSRHPQLQHSQIVQRFLEAEQMVGVEGQRRDSSVFDNITDVLVNAFSKVKRADEKFTEIKESIDKFEHNLFVVEKQHSRLLKSQSDLAVEFADLGGSLVSLALMETQISQQLNGLGSQLPQYSQLIKDKINAEEMNYVVNLREYMAYCHSVKEVLKLRDQKQIDHEELIQWLQGQQSDRDRAMSTGKSPGITGFFKDKLNDFKGVDPEKARQLRMVKLDAKIHELEEAVQQSGVTAEAFSNEVIKEVENFNLVKNIDFKQILQDHVDAQLEYHEKSLNFWTNILPTADEISLSFSPEKTVKLDEPQQ